MSCILIGLLVGVSGGHAPKGETELPAVASMMNASSHTLGRISKHVEKIGSHMNELISAQKKELAQQKTKYEKQLKEEADENAKLEAQNEKESTEIWELEKSNDDLRAQAKKLQKENANLRNAFTTVQAKIAAVNKYSKKALDSTDDEGNAELAVLNQKEGKDKDTEEDTEQDGDEKKDEAADTESKDEDAAAKDSDADQEAAAKDSDSDQDSDPANATATQDADSDSGAQSFMAIRSKTTRTRRTRRDDGDADDNQDEEQAPTEEASSDSSSDDDSQASQNVTQPEPESQEMVEELTKEITQLSKQQDNSRAELAKLFQARFKAGADKKAQILAKQDLLNSTKTSLMQLHTELQGAVKHLKGTKSKLENNLHGLGRYLAQLATYVTEPAADAEKALPTLPKDVQTFLQTKN